MSIQRALQLTTAAVAVIGAIFLALGHESTWLPALLTLAAVISVLLTDLVPWMRLNRIVSNLFAVAAVVWSLYDFLNLSPDQQLMAIAQMLVFLQILLLFQEKSGRTYWQLLVLSLLQVVVAAALSSGPQFGLLLVAYLLLALLSLVLLCIYSDLRLDPERPAKKSRPQEEAAWASLLALPEVESLTPAEAEAKPATRHWSLVRQVALLATTALGFALVFFYTTPRLHDGPWRGTRMSGGSRAGFTSEVSIKEYGRIHLSNQVVMRVAFTSPVDGKPYALVGDPYLQGGVLTRYQTDAGGSRWLLASRNDSNSSRGAFRRTSTVRPSEAKLVRQTCVLEVAHSDQAFAVMPLVPGSGTSRVLSLDRRSGRLKRSDYSGNAFSRELGYAYLTPAFEKGRQLRAIPHYNPAKTFAEMSLLDEELYELRYCDTSRFARLKQIAEVVLRKAGASEADPLKRAQELEKHFFEPGRYRYSLNLDFRRDPDLDPIEDFLSNHHTGHCEYFASALVLMLRSQGIPARMVVGFKGGEFNMLGQYYVVRQKHAHAWVEAWMPPGAVSSEEVAGTQHEGGVWYRLDPTPASELALLAEGEQSLQDRLTDAFDYAELMWRDYVLNLNAFSQQQAVTDPLTIGVAGSLPAWIDLNRLERKWQRTSERLGLSDRRRQPGEVDWPLTVLVALLMTGLILAARFGPSLLVWLKHCWLRRGMRHQSRAPDFYVRLERLLAQLPLRRAAGQTPRELAAAASQRLVRGEQRAAADLPEEIVEMYYRVRFGGDALDKQETEGIEQSLTQLVPAVRQAQKR